MKGFTVSLVAAASALTCALASGSVGSASTVPLIKRQGRPSRALHAPPSKRSPATDAAQLAIVQQAITDPVGAAIAAQGLDGVRGNTQGGDLAAGTIIQGDSESNPDAQANQYPWNAQVPFVPNAAATAGTGVDQGWTALPQLSGFDLIRTQVIRDNATQPFYISSGYDARAIKKAVIVMPGKPRDSWKYTGLMRNALSVATQTFPELGITPGSVLVIGPAWLNDADQSYGAALSTDLVFHGSQWQTSGNSRSPNLTHSIPSFEVIDWFADWLFNKTNFPALNSVTVAGHSLGGQAVVRYALLKKQKVYDNNMEFWVGNPGSYAWLNSNRSLQNASCTDFDDWHYGIGGNLTKITKYARADVIANKTAVIQRFLGRKIHYAYGLLDNGPGDTHCEAVMQGGNHLDRGANFIQLLGAMPGGFPMTTQTASFVANASHQDYAMMSANSSVQNIFKSGYDTRLPDIIASNPGDKNNSAPPPRAFATPVHKIISYALLSGSAGALVLIFTLLPFLFPSNTTRWEQDEWEEDSKRKLL